MNRDLVVFLLAGLAIAGCAGHPTEAILSTQPRTSKISTTQAQPVRPSDTPATASTSQLAPTQTVTGQKQNTIVVDHRSLALFDQIPNQYIEAAHNLRMMFMDRSVGQNINDGLDCLQFPSNKQAPNHCVRTKHVDPAYSVDLSVIAWEHPGGYNRSNWDFETWPQQGCAAWYKKVQCFLDFLGPVLQYYDVVSYQLSYLAVDKGSTVNNQPGGFFSDNPEIADVFVEAAFEEKHPDKVFIYWTTSLARGIGTEESDVFNERMREYAGTHGKPLFDVADILSHSPDGSPCYDNRDGIPYRNGNASENYPDDGEGHLAICPQYTTEVDGGHLGSVSAGKISVAKAFWVLMAQIAGWRPG